MAGDKVFDDNDPTPVDVPDHPGPDHPPDTLERRLAIAQADIRALQLELEHARRDLALTGTERDQLAERGGMLSEEVLRLRAEIVHLKIEVARLTRELAEAKKAK